MHVKDQCQTCLHLGKRDSVLVPWYHIYKMHSLFSLFGLQRKTMDSSVYFFQWIMEEGWAEQTEPCSPEHLDWEQVRKELQPRPWEVEWGTTSVWLCKLQNTQSRQGFPNDCIPPPPFPVSSRELLRTFWKGMRKCGMRAGTCWSSSLGSWTMSICRPVLGEFRTTGPTPPSFLLYASSSFLSLRSQVLGLTWERVSSSRL